MSSPVPREICYSVASVPDSSLTLRRGKIRVCTPLNYLSGSMAVAVKYEIHRGSYGTDCETRIFTCLDQYVDCVGETESLQWAKHTPTVYADPPIQKGIA